MDQMETEPDPADQAALMSTHRVVSSVMGLLTRSDIGPPPDVPSGPAIYAANHRSLADLLLASIAFCSWGRPIRPLVASSYFRKPAIGPLLSRLRCIPVDGHEALELATSEIEAGWSVAIMPEGRVVPVEEWAADGVGRLRSGVGRLALSTGLPVVANGASGTEAFWPRGSTLPRIRPWRRYPLALRSEVLGTITADSSRDATEVVRRAVVRCVEQADAATELMRRSR
jgi:1-acyl-sn-glycerol-3-phosphate acyltransferase